MGRDADQDIVQSLGLMEDTGWQECVQALGGRMARQSERPNLPWTFPLGLSRPRMGVGSWRRSVWSG